MSGRAESVRHIQASQVWPNSRGMKTFVHAHLGEYVTLDSVNGRRTTISRQPYQSLCGRRPWMSDEPNGTETRCPKCEAFANRYGIEWPLSRAEQEREDLEAAGQA